jgi:hypothetical protein
MKSRKRILWDLDDTLNPLIRSWLSWVARLKRKTEIPTYSMIQENPPHNHFGMTLNDFLESLDRFRVSTEAFSMPVDPDVLGWFNAHGHRFDHHVLTARPHFNVNAGADWVFRNLGIWIRHFHFVPAKRPESCLPDAGSSKAAFIRHLGASFDYFLDDTDINFLGTEECVNRCLLVPQPWNSQRLTMSEILSQIH